MNYFYWVNFLNKLYKSTYINGILKSSIWSKNEKKKKKKKKPKLKKKKKEKKKEKSLGKQIMWLPWLDNHT